MHGMSTLEIVIRFFAGAGLLAANGFFVMTEFAMTRIRQFPEEEMKGDKGLERAWEMTNELEIYLTSCQVGITVTSILLGVIFEPAMSAVLSPLFVAIGLGSTQTSVVAVVLAVMIIQFLHTVWGEQTPTYLGVERPKQVAKYCAGIVYVWTWFIYPAIWLGDKAAKWTLGLFDVEIERSWTKEEEAVEGPEVADAADLRRHIGELLSGGTLSEERQNEVLNALEIGSLETREIMVGRDDIEALSTERSPEENFEFLRSHHRARYPLVGASLDDYLGIVYAPALYPVVDELRDGQIQWRQVAVPPLTVQPDLPVSELIDRFQEERQELALVIDDDKRVLGLVTATDAFEAVMGDLEDPYD